MMIPTETMQAQVDETADRLEAAAEEMRELERRLLLAESLCITFYKHLREQNAPGWGNDEGYEAMYGPHVKGIRDRRGW